MPTDPTPIPSDDTRDAISELLAALRDPGDINPDLAAYLTHQLQTFLDQAPTSPPGQEK